jgi:hypothetical protein
MDPVVRKMAAIWASKPLIETFRSGRTSTLDTPMTTEAAMFVGMLPLIAAPARVRATPAEPGARSPPMETESPSNNSPT